MEPCKRSHILRATLIAGIGALITVILSVLIGWYVNQPRERMSSLAEKIDSASTVFFLRTTDISVVDGALSSWMEPEPVIDGAFTSPHGFEVAILNDGKNRPRSWKMEARSLANTGDVSLQSSGGTDGGDTRISSGSSATTIGDEASTMASSSFFRLHAPPLSDSGTNLAYMQLRDYPSTLQIANKPVIRALLHPFSDAMLTWTTERQNKERGGMLWLKPQLPLQYMTSLLIDERDRLKEESGTVLALHMSHPSQLLEAFQKNLTAEDPAFAEGFKGILQMTLRRLTGRTDIEQARQDLLMETAYLRIGTPAQGPRPFLFSGHARNAAVLDEWIGRMTAAATPGILRILPLSNGNQRIDVTAGDASLTERRPDGWMIRTIGDNASPVLIIATQGNAYVMSNDRRELDAFLIAGKMNLRTAKADTGFVNIGTFRTFLRGAMPILSDALPSPFVDPDGELRWSMKTTPGSVTVGWSWKNGQFPMSNVQIMSNAQ